MLPNVSQLLTKNKPLLLNQNLTCPNFGIYVATCVICHGQYVGQPTTNFPKDGQRITVIRINRIAKLTVTRTMTRWPCGTIQRAMAL